MVEVAEKSWDWDYWDGVLYSAIQGAMGGVIPEEHQVTDEPYQLLFNRISEVECAPRMSGSLAWPGKEWWR